MVQPEVRGLVRESGQCCYCIAARPQKVSHHDTVCHVIQSAQGQATVFDTVRQILALKVSVSLLHAGRAKVTPSCVCIPHKLGTDSENEIPPGMFMSTDIQRWF